MEKELDTILSNLVGAQVDIAFIRAKMRYGYLSKDEEKNVDEKIIELDKTINESIDALNEYFMSF